MLSEQQKELLQKEQQKAVSSKEMNEAKEQQHILESGLVEIWQLVQEVSMKSTILTRKKKILEIDLARKELKKEKISKLTSKRSKKLPSEMMYEVRLSIMDLKEDLEHLESKISEQSAKEEQVKQELRKKEKEADENRQAHEELKKKQALFTSELDSQKETLAEDVHQAENRQAELDHLLQEICASLQLLAKESADLAEEREQLKKEITKQERLQEKFLSQKASVEKEIFDEMLANMQASINKSRKRLAHVEAEIEKQRAKETQLRKEADNQEEELAKNHQVVYESEQKHSVICATLEAKRKIFDCQLRQKHQSGEALPEERKVRAS